MNDKESACFSKPINLVSRTDKMMDETLDIRFLSYNIQHGVGIDGKLDLSRIEEVIRQSTSDIVALQEVDNHFGTRSNYENQAELLAKSLGYHYVFGASIDLEPASGQLNKQQYGTAILSRYPIYAAHILPLSSDAEEQRTMLHAIINLNGAELNVYNVHLGLDSISRMIQAGEITDYMKKQTGPYVLLGDSNAPPEEKEMLLLVEQGNLIDPFRNLNNSATYPAWDPEKRIDYILLSPSFYLLDQAVIQSDASDHLPITSGVSLKINELSEKAEQTYKEILPAF